VVSVAKFFFDWLVTYTHTHTPSGSWTHDLTLHRTLARGGDDSCKVWVIKSLLLH